MQSRALDDFYDYMKGILVQYKDLIPVLKEEFEAVSNDDAAALDSIMNAQQVLLLSVRQFDINLEKHIKNIGLPASNLSELVANLEGDDATKFAELQKDFKTTLEEVLFYRNKCGELLTTKLHKIDSVLSASKHPRENITYDNRASEVQTSLFPKSFQTKI